MSDPVKPGDATRNDATRSDARRSDARRRAAIAGHTGEGHVARELVDHEDPTVRSSALHALERLGKMNAALVREGLVDPHPEVRRRALSLSISFPEIEIVSLLHDSDDSVVEQCAWACGERDAQPRVVETLSQIASEHPDNLCREAAVAALGAIGEVAGLPAILAAMNDIATVRRRAVIALAPFEGPEVDDALERALGDRDWQVRQAAEDLSHESP